MEFFTVGVNYYLGNVFHVYVTNNIETLKSQSAKEYYKIIHIESETSHIAINGNEYILVGAHVLCLNEQDDLMFYELPDNLVSILFFKPSVINSKFDFESCNYSYGLTRTERQDLDYLDKFKHKTMISSKIVPLNIIDSSVITQRLQQLNDQLTLQNTRFWPCRSRTCLFEILFSLVKPKENEDDMCPIRIASSFSKLTIDIICYLQTYYNKKITVEKLAQMFCTNRTTLLSDFKKSTGMSISQYQTQLRMKMAETLLRDTGLTITEICERTGFGDVSHFSKSFKKEIKNTPSEYRKMCANIE